MQNKCDIAVIGGGAAGIFAAIHAAEGKKRVVVLEKTAKLLSKVLVSGGGRCNVTHACGSTAELVKHYPRGGKKLRAAFDQFGTADTVDWFQSRGVPLKTESDGRMFPDSDRSQTIIDCLLREAEKRGVKIHLRSEVQEIRVADNGGFHLILAGDKELAAHRVIVSSGGNHKAAGYRWIEQLGIGVQAPIPSLFTFNVPDSDLKDLMGLSVASGWVQIPGTKWKSEGAVLITHWGFSAPAVIKLSSFAAVDLHSRQYQFPILINWVGKTEEEVRQLFAKIRIEHARQNILKRAQFDLSARLWQRLAQKAGVLENFRWADLPAKIANRFIELLVRSPYSVNGKTTFKEEFVTCGGVKLNEINLKTFESKQVSGLYFAGEVLNVDGLTGGFNFQHAWTSGYLSGKHASNTLD